MKYKAGDRVKLVDSYRTTWLKKWLGKVVTIDTVENGFYTTLEICSYFLTEDLIEGLAEEEIEITEGEAAFMEMMAEDPGEISDGYHTFNELYEYRLLYNASMFNELAKQNLYDVHKSRLHSDGTVPFDNPDYFIVVAELPTGQISNHYKMKDWDLFDVPVKDKANKYDGHSPKDVAERLRKFLTPKPKYPKTYKGCCDTLYRNSRHDECYEACLQGHPMQTFARLLICRDAYWKIYGEEFNWDDALYYIYTDEYGNVIDSDDLKGPNCVLAFPNAESRDAYKENFGPDIEICKEFL